MQPEFPVVLLVMMLADIMGWFPGGTRLFEETTTVAMVIFKLFHVAWDATWLFLYISGGV